MTEIALEHSTYFAVFNADEDPVCILHIDQARWLFYSLDGQPAEYWKKLSVFIPARVPYEPTDQDYDDLAHLYFRGY